MKTFEWINGCKGFRPQSRVSVADLTTFNYKKFIKFRVALDYLGQEKRRLVDIWSKLVRIFDHPTPAIVVITILTKSDEQISVEWQFTQTIMWIE